MPRNLDPAAMMMEATLKGFQHVNVALAAVQEVQKIQAKATYQGLTGSGKSRYVSELAKAYGGQSPVADLLDLSRGRISQLVNSEKNKKNGQ